MYFMSLGTITGKTEQFKGNGRKLGYPTANIHSDTEMKDGVYFGQADLDEFARHPSLIFIGTPTTMGDTDRRVEVYLLDIPDKDYYDQDLTVKLEYFHRANKTFANMEDLLEVMHDDEKQAREWFAQASSGTDRP